MTARDDLSSRHPEHDAVAAAVAGWFTTSAPEIDYRVTEAWYGYLCRFGALGSTRLILRLDEPSDVARALEEIAREHRGESLTLWVDDRERAARLDSALTAAGCEAKEATSHLALVGETSAPPPPPDLVVETVGETGLDRWSLVKIRSFEDSEAAPSPERLAAELAVRTTELPIARHWLASLGGEPVAVLAYYHGEDQLVFNLGTRLPFRHRGIARALLARFVSEGRTEGCRSLLINAHEGGKPAELYRRLGFVDEVYWYRRYVLGAGESGL